MAQAKGWCLFPAVIVCELVRPRQPGLRLLRLSPERRRKTGAETINMQARFWISFLQCGYLLQIPYCNKAKRAYWGIIVGGVGEGEGVSVGGGVFVGSGVFVGGAGVGDRLGVSVGRGLRVGVGLSVGVEVRVGVSEGGRTRVGLISASGGYNCFIAVYQSKPSVNANSLKRAP